MQAARRANRKTARTVDAERVAAFLDGAMAEVFGYLLHRCGTRVIAEDLTSETFLAAVGSVRLDREELSMPWLIGIARHKLIDHWRRQEREDRHRAPLDDAVPRPGDDLARFEPGPAAAALAELNPFQRAALTLRYIDGLPTAEVARLLGRSVPATETLITRARAAFRRQYEEQVVGDEGGGR